MNIEERDKQEQAIIDLTDSAKIYQDWLVIVRFGLPTLLNNQVFLWELIDRRVKKDHERGGAPVGELIRKILAELGLNIGMG